MTPLAPPVTPQNMVRFVQRIDDYFASPEYKEHKRERKLDGVVPGTTHCLLTRASKMPCRSWSLPAARPGLGNGGACPGSVYGKNSQCGSCYATKGMYTFACVVKAQNARFAWARTCMKSEAGRDEFVSVLTRAIEKATKKKRKNGRLVRGKRYFRVHDSGDLFSPAYTGCWTRICTNLPRVRFWFPTRMYPHEGKQVGLLAIAAVLELAALKNTTVRPSSLHFDDAPPVVAGYGPGTSATKVGYTCPAHEQGNACGTCRACWDSPDAVTYRRH